MGRSSAIGPTLLLAGALLLCSPAFAKDAVTVHVPAKPMAEALIDFATQAHFSIGESGIDFHGVMSRPVDGTFAPDDALRRILAGSGYTFEFVDANTVRIRPATRAAQIHSPAAVAIEQVVVTATKRDAVAQTLPYSIVVLDGGDLDGLGTRSTHGLASEVAGLTETNLGPGQDKLFVRGLTDSVLPGLSESVVGVYLDEARIADDAPAPELRLVDIERIEVLRGPLGSLYGAGSLTGLLRIIPRKPVYDAVETTARTSVSLTEGGGPSASVEATLNLPIVRDELALRLVGYGETTGGYVDDTRIGGSNTNRTAVQGGRAALSWKPDDVWTVVGSVVVQRIEARDSQYYLADLQPQDRDLYLREPHSDQLLQAGITATAHFGWADFVTSSSFLDRRIEARFDASLAWHGLTGFPRGPSAFDFARTIRSYTEEARLASPDGERFKWLAGIYYSHRDEKFRSDLSGPDPLDNIVLARTEDRDDNANESALFGELSYDIVPSLTVGAGARVFRSSHFVDADTDGLLIDPPETFRDSTSQWGVMPKAVLSWRPDDETTLYAQFSEGYRLGGLNVDGPPDATGEFDHDFDSDLLRNYEVGAKMQFWDARVTANVTAYYVLWKNLQTDQIGPDGTFFILNAGDVHDYGIETDVRVRPFDGLSLEAHGFWNKTKLSNSDPRLAAAEGVLPGAPHIGLGLLARYDVPIDETNTAFAIVDYGYVGESHLGFNEETPQMGNYHLIDIRFGLERGHWRATLFVDNLDNTTGNTFAFGNPFHPARSPQATTARPRTLGVSLQWSQ